MEARGRGAVHGASLVLVVLLNLPGSAAEHVVLARTPLAGSCRHYSLVDGGKFQEEQMPAGTG